MVEELKPDQAKAPSSWLAFLCVRGGAIWFQLHTHTHKGSCPGAARMKSSSCCRFLPSFLGCFLGETVGFPSPEPELLALDGKGQHARTRPPGERWVQEPGALWAFRGQRFDRALTSLPPSLPATALVLINKNSQEDQPQTMAMPPTSQPPFTRSNAKPGKRPLPHSPLPSPQHNKPLQKAQEPTCSHATAQGNAFPSILRKRGGGGWRQDRTRPKNEMIGTEKDAKKQRRESGRGNQTTVAFNRQERKFIPKSNS